MENRIGKVGGEENSFRKARSLDLQSIYRSGVSKEGTKKKTNFVVENDVEVGKEEKKRKRSSSGRKNDGSLSRLDSEAKKRAKFSDEEDKNGVRLGPVDSGRLLPSLSQKLNSSNASIGISLSFDQNGNVFRIPKRPRGSVGRKRFVGDSGSKPFGEPGSVDGVATINGEVKKATGERESKLSVSSGGEVGSSDSAAGKLNGSSPSNVAIPKVKRTTGVRESEESRNTSEHLSRHVKGGDGLVIVGNGGKSSRKCRTNYRKRKNLSSGSETAVKKVEPLVDNAVDMPVVSPDDDDEENLEQNAARMLSSRFDPSCTGFLAKTASSPSPSTNGYSSMISSDQDFVDRDVNSLAGSESSSVDNSNRVLRRRKQQKDKDLSRKCRHFYEILPRDLDAYWVLNRRIKVFWPLDKSWYHGLVSDYDREEELHHIKYDDRDEEWINLQKEKFKLLLLPDEVPGKSVLKESEGVKAVNEGKIADDNVHNGKCLDSEPIICWLARSSQRVKHSSSSHMKKQKVSELPSSIKSSLSFDKVNAAKGNVDSLGKHGTKTGGDVALPDRLTDGGRAEKSLSGRSTSSEVREPFVNSGRDEISWPGRPSSSGVREPIVYFRRRFHKKGKKLSSASGNEIACKISPGALTFLIPESCGSLTWKEYGTSFVERPGSDKLFWVLDGSGYPKLSMQLIESGGYRFTICLPALPSLGHLLSSKDLWLCRTVLLLHYGAIITRWPVVILDMLFVDNVVGLRSVFFEGSVENAVAFLFLVLSVFKRHTEVGMPVDLHLPVTSIRVRVSSVRDPRKQHVFTFSIFSKLKRSKWLYLDSELQRHCLLTQQLPLSECTYGNIKALEGRRLEVPYAYPRLLICEDLQETSIQDALPICLFRESCHTMMGHSAISFATKPGKLPPFSVSFSAAPTFFLGLHLKMLMNHNFDCTNLEDFDSISSLEVPENTKQPVYRACRQVKSCSEKDMVIVPVSYVGNPLADAALSKCLSPVEPLLEKDVIPVGDTIKPSQDLQNGKPYAAESSQSFKNLRENATGSILESDKCDSNGNELEQFVASSQPSVFRTIASPTFSCPSTYSGLGERSVEIPSSDQVERSLDEGVHLSRQTSDLTINATSVHSPNITGPRSLWQHSKSSVNSPLQDLSPRWPDWKTNIVHGVFSNGPKKPRTQVQYTVPFGGYDLSSKPKSHNQRTFPYKRIRRADDKRILDGSRSSRRSLELSACDANVLVTVGDKGWREHGARVVLELANHNEWRISVRLSGITKYSYKVNNILQPGSTNRYTHAMMWKGGKDWVLEFPDRSLWMLFKEMYEECYNRNIRAATVKNIPIPGVRSMEETDDTTTNMSFVRSSKYFRQVENDVDMALNLSHVLYDMDSEDEQWLSENKRSLFTDKDKLDEISDMLFEKTIDMFEKVAYSQQREHFTSDEIEELTAGLGSTEVSKVIYEHWRQKRERKGMALIRHLQTPLWERYEQQVKQWEQAVARANTVLSSGCQERAHLEEKPSMFAFCLKPRGLEIPNKGSKQRSQKKLPVAMHNHAVSGDQDGRRFNGVAFGDEKSVFPGNGLDSSEASPLLEASTRAFSPRDSSGLGHFSLSSDVYEWNHQTKLPRNMGKKIGGFPSPSNPGMLASYNQRMIGKRNGVNQWNMDVPEWPNQKHYYHEGSYRHSIRQLDSSELQDFRLRDASRAAQHARNMAKLRRERAQRLLYRADLAIHKAVVAIMTAEAVKAAFDTSNDDG